MVKIITYITKNRSRLSAVVFVTALVIIGIVLVQTWHQIPHEKLSFNTGYLVISLLLYIAANTFAVWLWYTIIRMTGNKPPFLLVWRASAYSSLMRYIPGRIWNYAGKVHWVAKSGIPEQVVLFTTFLDLLLLLIGSMGLSLYSLQAFLPRRYIALIIAVSIVCMLFFMQGTVLDKAITFLNKRKSKIDSVQNHFSYKKTLALVCGYTVYWFCIGVQMFLLAKAFCTLEWNMLVPFVTLRTASWLVGFLSFIAPAGIGVQDGVFIAGFAPIASLGVAAFVGIIIRLFFILIETAYALVFLCFDPGAWKNVFKKGDPLDSEKRAS